MPSSAKPPEQQQQSNTPTVRLTADRILMSEGDKNEKEVTMNELRADLWKRNFPKLSEKNRAVVVETAPEVTYERYYQVATAIAAAGGVVAIMSEQ
jgi:biopolymer transport protein ExbD